MDWAGRLEVDSRNVFISLGGELVFFVTREKGRETTTKEM